MVTFNADTDLDVTDIILDECESKVLNTGRGLVVELRARWVYFVGFPSSLSIYCPFRTLTSLLTFVARL